MLEEKDLAEAAEKAAAGDKVAAAATLASALVTVVTGHPVAGAFARGGLEFLARATVDSATKRLLTAGEQWDSEQEKSAALQKLMIATSSRFSWKTSPS